MSRSTIQQLQEDTPLSSILPNIRWMEQEETSMSSSSAKDERIDLAASIVSSIFLFLLIFGLSATVDVRHLKQELRNKFALLTGVVMQFLIMPLLGFLSVLALRNQGLTQAMGITLLVVTASPGGSYSNWWCSTFNADLALSVAMTAVSTILSIGLLPANLFIYSLLVYGISEEQGVLQSLDLKAIFTSLAIVIAAILSGLYASYKVDSERFHTMANRLGSVCGVLLILTSVFLSSGEETNFWSLPWTFYIGVTMPCLIGLILANLACRLFQLKKPEQVAISIECCYQNVGIATSVAVNMFDDPVDRAQALSVPLLYGLFEALLICIYCVWSWKMGWTKAPKDEKLCVVVTKTYEVRHDGQDSDDDQDNDLPAEAVRVDDHSDDDDENHTENDTPPDTIHLTGWRAWLAWPFIPRYPDTLPLRHEQQDEDVELALPSSTTPKSPDQQDRCRMVSEDYTAATSTTDGGMSSSTSPPNTPGALEQEGVELQPASLQEHSSLEGFDEIPE